MYWGYQSFKTTASASFAPTSDERAQAAVAAASPTVYDQMGAIAHLPPGVTFERCLELNPANVLAYAFEADQPVAFDLHYHTYGLIYYALRKEVASEARTYRPMRSRKYCLSWRNTSGKAIRLSWGYSPRES